MCNMAGKPVICATRMFQPPPFIPKPLLDRQDATMTKLC